MRKIKIYTTAGMPGTIETNVSTLGELKPLLTQREINYIGIKMLVGETKNELTMDESVLPEGDFKLYLMPAKTKSGVDFEEMEETLRRIERKLDTILNTNTCKANTTSVLVAPSLSLEDAKEVEELNRLVSGGSITREWD